MFVVSHFFLMDIPVLEPHLPNLGISNSNLLLRMYVANLLLRMYVAVTPGSTNQMQHVRLVPFVCHGS